MLVYIVLIQKKGSFVSQLFSYFKQSPRVEVKFFWTSNTWGWTSPSFSFRIKLKKKLRAFLKNGKISHIRLSENYDFSYNYFFFSKTLSLTTYMLYIVGKVSSRRRLLMRFQISEVTPWKGQRGFLWIFWVFLQYFMSKMFEIKHD